MYIVLPFLCKVRISIQFSGDQNMETGGQSVGQQLETEIMNSKPGATYPRTELQRVTLSMMFNSHQPSHLPSTFNI